MPSDVSQKRRRRGAVGLALALVAPLALAGCANQQNGPPTLMWYINPDDGGQAELAQRCTAASGGKYSIETSVLPRDAASQREQLARRLAAGDASMDIMSLDPPYVPELANPGFLAPVPEALQKASLSDDVVEGAKRGAQWDGKVVAVPFWANTQLLWYRKSVAQKAGLDMNQPVTWSQLLDAVRKTDTYIGVQGIRGESMTVWVNAMIESGGDHIVRNPTAPADQIDLGLDSDAGKAAATIVGTIGRDGLGGPGITTQDETVSYTLTVNDRRVDGSTGVIEMAHQKGLLVHTWTFRDDASGYGFKDPQAEMQYYMRLGIDGVFTDFTATGVAARAGLR